MDHRRTISLLPGYCSREVDHPYSLWDWMSLTQALGICAQLQRNLLHSNCHPLGHTGEVNGEAACRGQWGPVIGAKVFFSHCGFCSCGHQVFFLCLQYKSYSVVSHIIHTAQHCHFLTAYTVTYFIGGERDKRKLWGNVFSFRSWLFFCVNMAVICPSLIRPTWSAVLFTMLPVCCICHPKWLIIHDFYL